MTCEHSTDPQGLIYDSMNKSSWFQMVHVKTTEDLGRLVWVSPGCRGYLMLLHRPEVLLSFLDTDRDSWDYDGR